MDWDQLESMTVDCGVAAVTALLALSWVGDWLVAHPDIAYWTLTPLHLVMLPWMGFVLIAGQGQVELRRSLEPDPYNVLGWVGALHLGCGFMVPLLLGLIRVDDVHIAWYLTVLFGPFVLLGLTLWVLVRTDPGTPLPPKTPSWIRHTTAALALTYLTAMESALWVARSAGHEVLSVGVVLFGIAILGYLPTRLFLHFSLARRHPAATAALLLAFAWLLLQLALA